MPFAAQCASGLAFRPFPLMFLSFSLSVCCLTLLVQQPLVTQPQGWLRFQLIINRVVHRASNPQCTWVLTQNIIHFTHRGFPPAVDLRFLGGVAGVRHTLHHDQQLLLLLHQCLQHRCLCSVHVLIARPPLLRSCIQPANSHSTGRQVQVRYQTPVPCQTTT